MRLSAILLTALTLVGSAVLAQSPDQGSNGETAARQDGMTEIALSNITVEDMKGATVLSSDDEEVGRVSAVIPAEDGIDSILVDVHGQDRLAESSLSFLPGNLTLFRSDGSGELRLVTTMTADEIFALAATAN